MVKGNKKLSMMTKNNKGVKLKISDKSYEELAKLKKDLKIEGIGDSIRCGVPTPVFLGMEFAVQNRLDKGVERKLIKSFEDFEKNVERKEQEKHENFLDIMKEKIMVSLKENIEINNCVCGKKEININYEDIEEEIENLIERKKESNKKLGRLY